ncbi:hypothetical protein OIU84_008025 [Salix udensis]|uniref:Uncharacterized protein n=1 Tax=Salix udensis TaxID=889485 RepID=A0AAD6P010_9ROSI|nr:hypothetical protein OIU84_008025 [Salix udensis]
MSLPALAISLALLSTPNPAIPNPSIAASTPTRLRFYSDSSNNAPPPDALHGSSALAELKTKDDSNEVKDVSNKELREMIDNYSKGNGEVLPSIMEAILQRKLLRKHEETDDELIEELRMKPLSDVDEEEFQSDFDELYETDKELNDLCDAKEYVVKKMMQDQYFNMDDKKWDEMVKEAMDHGFIKDTKECEEILEDMLSWDKLLPDDIKEKVEKKFNELGDMCERGELEAEEAYELFKKFEDEMVMEYVKKMEAEGPPQFDEAIVPDKKKHSDDPPGTIPGRDELTITSERFEHREENRKDCLRTLFALIEEAGKATKLAEETRVSYCKDRLRANPAFMERLRSKIMRQGSNTISA